MTGNPSERDDTDFDDDEGFVIDSDVDSTATPHPLDEVFAEVDRELAKRRGMWTEAEAKFNDPESTLDDEEVFVLEEEDFDFAAGDAAPDDSPLTALSPLAAVEELADSEPDDGELRVTLGGEDDAFSADKSMFDVEAASEAEAAPAETAASDAGTDDDSEGELSMLDAIDASSAELEIIAEAADPFAHLGAAPSGEDDAAAEATDGDDWSPTMETDSQSLHRHEATWDGAQTEAAAAAFAEDADEDDPTRLEDELDDQLDSEATEDDFDPIYGDPQQEEDYVDAELAEAPEGEPDHSEYEETYAEADPALVVIGAPVRPRRGAWRVFAVAALLLIAAGGTLAVARPDLVGLADPARLVDRIEIARPMIDVVVAPPTPVVEPTPDPVVVVAPVLPPPVVEPPVVEPPVVEPRVATTPVPPVPVAVGPTPPPVSVTPEARPSGVLAPSNDLSRVGEDLEVRVAEAPVRGRVHELADGIATGNQAFAQLKNLNFFVGRVKAMDANFITLALDPGEITLAFEELTAIVPLASEEYRMMQGGQESFVRLRNSNRLFGRILANGGIADNIVIEVQKNLVTIPKHAIEEIGGQSALGVQVLQDDGGDWVERLLRKRNAEAGRTVMPTTGAESPRPGK